MAALAEELAAIVGERHVLVDPDLTASYAVDWTGRWRGDAALVARPGSTEEVAAVVAACAGRGVAVVPQGGNTGLVGGAVPDDGAVLLSLRRLAYRNRVEIYSIGTRVRLAQPTPELREKELVELRKWVDVAQKIGASHMRVFGGPLPQGATLDQAVGFAAETFKRGAEYSGARGITLGVEDDGGITDYAKETIEIVKRADSPWAGMTLDTGNFRPPKVYEQIEMSIPFAVGTHIKTQVALDDGKSRAEADWERIFGMFVRHGFRGYMGLEYGGEDAATSVPGHLRRLKELAVKYSA